MIHTQATTLDSVTTPNYQSIDKISSKKIRDKSLMPVKNTWYKQKINSDLDIRETVPRIL